ERARRRHDGSRSGRRDALLEARDETLDGLTPGRAEEIDLRHGGETLAKLREPRLDLRPRLLGQRARAGWERLLRERADVRGEGPGVLLPGTQEQGPHLVVGQAVDETRLAERRLPSFFLDLAQHPLEIFPSLVGVRERIDGVLERDGAERLEPAPDLHAQVGRLRRKLMNEHEPRFRLHDSGGYNSCIRAAKAVSIAPTISTGARRH